MNDSSRDEEIISAFCKDGGRGNFILVKLSNRSKKFIMQACLLILETKRERKMKK
jgi:hypothetical protein